MGESYPLPGASIFRTDPLGVFHYEKDFRNLAQNSVGKVHFRFLLT